MSSSIRVVVVDDHPLFREGVARSLEESGMFDVVGQGSSADDAVRLAEELTPDVILLDVSMPGNGLLAAVRISESAADVKTVMLTVSEADDDIIAALKAGAKGYVLKGVASATLVEIVASVARGESYVSPSLAARILSEMGVRRPASENAADPLSTLTRREEEILRLVAEGLSNKEVGLKLNLQEKTVKHHMTRIMGKLHVRNRTEAAVLLREATARRP
ncbi:MAG: response regulator transcription factor [Rhizobiales bacterium]|nr:response regulator transcription factor [Hyphomicrobiales bacterium]